jgi:S-adenosylhomocysteine hydrolase
MIAREKSLFCFFTKNVVMFTFNKIQHYMQIASMKIEKWAVKIDEITERQLRYFVFIFV